MNGYNYGHYDRKARIMAIATEVHDFLKGEASETTTNTNETNDTEADS